VRHALRNANLPLPQGYSRAVLAPAGETIYTSMTAPVDRDGGVVGPGDVTVQAQRVLANLGDILEQHGSSLDEVVKVTAYVVEAADLSAVMAVIAQTFAEPQPAISLAVTPLPNPSFLVEIDAVAAVRA
jgi:2-iminobutanoate/2-iminopropanoate deaminase